MARQTPLFGEVTFTDDVDVDTKAHLLKRVRIAEQLISAAVHPELLAGSTRPEVVVCSKTGRGSYGGAIKVSPWSDVETLVHEFGHHMEATGNKRFHLTALGLRTDRAFGYAPSSLKDLAEAATRDYGAAYRVYRKTEEAFVGAFFDIYAGKRYDLGHTELVAMGLALLADPKWADQVFRHDGNLVTTLIYMLQKPSEGQ